MNLKEYFPKITDKLFTFYSKNGTFGYHDELRFEGDTFFNFRDWRLMFKTVPRLRKDLLTGLLTKIGCALIFKKPDNPFGLQTLKYREGKKYNFFHACIFGDALILECLILAAEKSNQLNFLKEKYASEIQKISNSIGSEGRLIESNGKRFYKFSYYPQQNHMVQKNHPMYKYFESWDMAVPENDSSSIIYSFMMQVCRLLEINIPCLHSHDQMISDYIDNLKEHIWQKGKFGKGLLSYDRGYEKDETGILTWIHDQNNELDPTVNVNILSYLTSLMLRNYSIKQSTPIFHTILEFLFKLAHREKIFKPEFQQYYSKGALIFLWYRFLILYEKIPDSLKNEMDSNGRIKYLRKVFLNYSENDLVYPLSLMEPFDKLLSLPLLFFEKSDKSEVLFSEIKKLREEHFFSANKFSFLHFRYPVKIICTMENISEPVFLLAMAERMNR